jgi:hypothetical protein
MTERRRINIRANVGATINTNAMIWFHSRSFDLTIPSPAIVIAKNT